MERIRFFNIIFYRVIISRSLETDRKFTKVCSAKREGENRLALEINFPTREAVYFIETFRLGKSRYTRRFIPAKVRAHPPQPGARNE